MARKPPYPTEAATRRDRLVMAVVSLTENDDWERVRLSTHPKFLAIIERSRAAHTPGTGISTAEMRHRLGLGRRKSRI
jgi:hypothetical protein